MLESLSITLLKALATYLFKTYVFLQSNVKIDGAPYWYMQNTSKAVCVYASATGGLEAVDTAKAASSQKMAGELSRIMQAVVYDGYHNLKDPKEKAFVNSFVNDPDASIFVNKSIQYPNVEYISKQRTAYVKGCIDKQTIIDYQTERADKIKYELTHMRADNAFDELGNADPTIKGEPDLK